MKVLIVDGSKAERSRLVDAFCQITNIVVIGAVSRLHTALHALGQSHPDIVVTDSRLGDDEDATALIAAARRSACPPAIIVYATAETRDDRRRCLEAGADRYVAKHAGFAALQHAVVELGMTRQVGMRALHEHAFVGRVAAGLAHDLNNQLTVVDAALGLLGKQLPAAKPSSELSLARRAVDSANQLAQALSRHSHRSKQAAMRVDLGTLVRRTLDLFGRSIPMSVETDLALAETAPIVAVEQELEQLVMNLVLDACDSLRGTGRVVVRVHQVQPAKVQLVVTHTGDATPVRVDFDAAN